MTYFTADNSTFSANDREIVNCAFDEAWSAIKGRAHRLGGEIADPENLRKSLGDAINNEFAPDTRANDLSEAALARLGFTPRRDVYSLECE